MIQVINVLRNYYVYKEYPLGTEEYEATLNLSVVLKNLLERGVLSNQDLVILSYFVQGFSLRKISEMLDLDRKTVTKNFKRAVLFIGLNYES